MERELWKSIKLGVKKKIVVYYNIGIRERQLKIMRSTSQTVFSRCPAYTSAGRVELLNDGEVSGALFKGGCSVHTIRHLEISRYSVNERREQINVYTARLKRYGLRRQYCPLFVIVWVDSVKLRTVIGSRLTRVTRPDGVMRRTRSPSDDSYFVAEFV